MVLTAAKQGIPPAGTRYRVTCMVPGNGSAKILCCTTNSKNLIIKIIILNTLCIPIKFTVNNATILS